MFPDNDENSNIPNTPLQTFCNQILNALQVHLKKKTDSISKSKSLIFTTAFLGTDFSVCLVHFEQLEVRIRKIIIYFLVVQEILKVSKSYPRKILLLYLPVWFISLF